MSKKNDYNLKKGIFGNLNISKPNSLLEETDLKVKTNPKKPKKK